MTVALGLSGISDDIIISAENIAKLAMLKKMALRNQPTPALLRLPFELLDEVTRQLDVCSFVRFAATCRQLYRAAPSLVTHNREASLFSAVRAGDIESFRTHYSALNLSDIRSLATGRKRRFHHLLHACQWVLALERRDAGLQWWTPLSQVSDQLFDRHIVNMRRLFEPVVDAEDIRQFGNFLPRLLQKVVGADFNNVLGTALIRSYCCLRGKAGVYAICARVCRDQSMTQRSRIDALMRLVSIPALSRDPDNQPDLTSFLKSLVATRELAVIIPVALSMFRTASCSFSNVLAALLDVDDREPAGIHIRDLLLRTYLAGLDEMSNEKPENLTLSCPRDDSSSLAQRLESEFILHGVFGLESHHFMRAIGYLPFHDFLASLLGASDTKPHHQPGALTWFFSHVQLHLHTLHTLPFNSQCKHTSASLQQLLDHIPLDVAGTAGHRQMPLTAANILHETRCARCGAIAKTILASPEFSKNRALVRMAATGQWFVSYDPILPATVLEEARALAEVIQSMDCGAGKGAGAAAAGSGSPWLDYFEFVLADQLVADEREHVYDLDWRGGGTGVNTPDLDTLVYIYCRGGRFGRAIELVDTKTCTKSPEQVVLGRCLLDWMQQCVADPEAAIDSGSSPVDIAKVHHGLASLVLLVDERELVDPALSASEEFPRLRQWALSKVLPSEDELRAEV